MVFLLLSYVFWISNRLTFFNHFNGSFSYRQHVRSFTNFVIDAEIHRWFVQSCFHRQSFSQVSFVRKHGSYPSLIWISRTISCFVRLAPIFTPHVLAISRISLIFISYTSPNIFIVSSSMVIFPDDRRILGFYHLR